MGGTGKRHPRGMESVSVQQGKVSECWAAHCDWGGGGERNLTLLHTILNTARVHVPRIGREKISNLVSCEGKESKFWRKLGRAVHSVPELQLQLLGSFCRLQTYLRVQEGVVGTNQLTWPIFLCDDQKAANCRDPPLCRLCLPRAVSLRRGGGRQKGACDEQNAAAPPQAHSILVCTSGTMPPEGTALGPLCQGVTLGTSSCQARV